MPKINKEEYDILKSLDDKWKWIARDEDGEAFMYECEPYRIGTLWDIDDSRHDHDLLREDNLFRFIQWEDEEPYNISELIKEYEYHNEPVKLAGGLSITQAKYDKYLEEHIKELENESEEIEMKKDILWAKIKIHEELDSWCGVEGGIDGDGINNVLNILDQLDEPEVLSDKWIDDNSVYASSDGVTEEYVHVDDLQGLFVLKQGEIDQAYKDGYEKGKEQGFCKGYREGLANKGGKPETVSDVVADFYEACDRLQGVMSMEVKELDE